MNLRSLCPPGLFPVLQKICSIKKIRRFEYYKRNNTVDSRKVLLFSVSRRTLSGNLLYIYNEIMKQPGRYDVDVILEDDGTSEDELLRRISVAKYVVIDDYTKMIYPLTMRPETKLIQVWHSTGAFKRMGFSRMGKEGSTISTSLTHRNYTDVIVSSKAVVKNFEEAFGVDRKHIHPLGVPRTDVFFDEEYIRKKKIEIYGLFPELIEKKLVMFAPTFRGKTRKEAFYPENYFHKEAFVEQLGDEYILGMKLHPFISKKIDVKTEYKDRIIDFSSYREINDLLFVTDILITDYSSVIFEYAFLKKPLVFYIPDLKQYVAERDFFYDFEEYIYGNTAENEAELLNAVLNPTLNMTKLEGFKEKFLEACDGKSSARFVEKVLCEGDTQCQR